MAGVCKSETWLWTEFKKLNVFMPWQAFEEGAEILYQIFGPGLLGSWAGGNLCKSEIAPKAISLHDLAGAGAKSAKNGTRFRLRLPRSAIALFLRTDQQGKLKRRWCS